MKRKIAFLVLLVELSCTAFAQSATTVVNTKFVAASQYSTDGCYITHFALEIQQTANGNLFGGLELDQLDNCDLLYVSLSETQGWDVLKYLKVSIAPTAASVYGTLPVYDTIVGQWISVTVNLTWKATAPPTQEKITLVYPWETDKGNGLLRPAFATGTVTASNGLKLNVSSSAEIGTFTNLTILK